MTHGLCLIEQFGKDRPNEGMNSQGLFIGMTGIHANDFPSRKPGNHTLQLDEFGIIRFVLERVSNTQEAVAILDQIKIVSHNIEPYVRLQYFIIDRYGEVCIIAGQEKTDIQRLDGITFSGITNFPLSLRNKIICDRFSTLQSELPHITNEQEALALVQVRFYRANCLFLLVSSDPMNGQYLS